MSVILIYNPLSGTAPESGSRVPASEGSGLHSVAREAPGRNGRTEELIRNENYDNKELTDLTERCVFENVHSYGRLISVGNFRG